MCAPSTTCCFITSNSSFVSLSGLLRTSSGVLTLPMSCISAAKPNSRRSVPSTLSARACAIASAERRRRRPVAEDGDEVPDLVARETARQRDLLDAALAQIAREADERRGPARQAVAVDDDFVADEADDDGRRRLERFGRGGIQGIESALHEGVVRRIELGTPQRCRKPAYQFLGLLDMQVSF